MPDEVSDSPALNAKTDRELLLLTAAEMGHMKGHMASMDGRLDTQNGRLSVLEKWRWTMSGGLVLIGAGWPLLIYEVRQFVLEKFGFIP